MQPSEMEHLAQWMDRIGGRLINLDENQMIDVPAEIENNSIWVNFKLKSKSK